MIRIALILFVLPMTAVANDPFACVDPDIADAFLGYWHESRPQYSTSVPADFFDTKLPATFELVGSKSSDSNVTVVYKSRQSAEAALASSMKAMEDAGWKDFTLSYRASLGGFRSQSVPTSASMCHDSYPGEMNIIAKQSSGRTFVSFAVYHQDRSRKCSDLTPSPDMQDRIPLKKYLPILNIPANAKLTRNGSGGGGDEYSAYIVVSTTVSRDELLRHFDDQIRDQLWLADTGWSGNSSLGSVWSKTGTNNDALVGELRIAEASIGVFNVRFTVSSVDPGNYYSGTSRSSGTN